MARMADWMYGTPEEPHRRFVVFYAASLVASGLAFMISGLHVL